MLPIAVEVAGAVCGTDCSVFSQTPDCLPLTACRSLAGQVVRSRIALLWLRNARIFSTFSLDMLGSGCGGVIAVLRLES